MILFLSFLALSSSPGTDIKVFATALGIGILLDATVVRALLVPALVSLFGRWNWWLPVLGREAADGRAARRDPGAAPPSPSWSAPTTERSAPTTTPAQGLGQARKIRLTDRVTVPPDLVRTARPVSTCRLPGASFAPLTVALE